MKRLGVLVLFVLLFVCFAVADPSVGTIGSDAEKYKDTIDKTLPFGDSGDIDFKPYTSKAEERIAAINTYVGPITKTLWGVELTLSWVFLFSFIVWILMIEFIVMPVSEIFDWGIWWSLAGAGMIATLAMQGFGKDFVAYMSSLMTAWWIGVVALVGAVFVAMTYSYFVHSVGAWVKKIKEKDKADQTDRDRKVLHIHAKLAQDNFN
ncbi:MAG: hypothetical protein KJ592_03085 [Nanoarchaeota archaeon]|nr:hypothetical protein [Nanoarchaeota archaeon]